GARRRGRLALGSRGAPGLARAAALEGLREPPLWLAVPRPQQGRPTPLVRDARVRQPRQGARVLSAQKGCSLLTSGRAPLRFRRVRSAIAAACAALLVGLAPPAAFACACLRDARPSAAAS